MRVIVKSLPICAPGRRSPLLVDDHPRGRARIDAMPVAVLAPASVVAFGAPLDRDNLKDGNEAAERAPTDDPQRT
jgi:hypothetical protein